MSILIDQQTKVIVQGTGAQGTFHAQRNQRYGTNVVGGVHPKKGGQTWEELGLPLFPNVAEAVAETGANTSMIMVPAPFTKDAILEAHEAGIETIVTVTEGMPVHDMAVVYNTLYPRRDDGTFAKEGRPVLIGPNCPGIISPGKANVGIIPGEITMPGNVGLVSRSGTLTYQIMHELALAGIGVSTCVGIGGDPIIGSDFLDVIERFAEDDATEAIVFVGEIGGTEEQKVGRWIADHIPQTPVVAYVAGFSAPPGKQMGHAGAIVKEGGEGGETAAEKKADLEQLGIWVGGNPTETAQKMIQALGR
ncbi:succinate--CoA ligase subunit alpha [Egibacter rhizosphaerae]|uniref:Succinate--CoA ligase [ADP-forming] subunit alpha n=1 Tax=Egibacter rhizosphaerae TaxID=1670831 RepID=A0A411YH91_9ACTN|nr:succinate--CoA ligase subunit alpha [Egibacter rhizosphaerae]QBI20603.1 succinate--CoA ligase subunit alpha [Egibacter rhizosphaerae]